MSLEKAILFGKEHRRVCHDEEMIASHRVNCGSWICRKGHQHSNALREMIAKEKVMEYFRDF